MPKGSHTSSGRVLEDTVKAVCTRKGFVVVKFSDWIRDRAKYGHELLLIDAPYRTIYDHPGRTEFLLLSHRYDLHVRIECKWQQSAGSVDEKLPYLYLNALEAVPEKHFVIIWGGAGWKHGAIPWLKRVAAGKRYATPASSSKTVEVFRLEEFITWANRTFR